MSPTCSKSVRRTKEISCETTKTKESIICNEELIDNIDFQRLKTAPEQKTTLPHILVGGLPVIFIPGGHQLQTFCPIPPHTLTSNVSTSTSVWIDFTPGNHSLHPMWNQTSPVFSVNLTKCFLWLHLTGRHRCFPKPKHFLKMAVSKRVVFPELLWHPWNKNVIG